MAGCEVQPAPGSWAASTAAPRSWRAANTARNWISNPHVRAGISVGRIDVKQICLRHLSQGLAQFGGSVPGAEKRVAPKFRCARSDRGWKLRGVKSTARTRHCRNRCTRRAIFQGALPSRRQLPSAALRRRKSSLPRKKYCVKFSPSGSKATTPAGPGREFRLQKTGQAIKANRNFRPLGIAARPGLATQVQRVRNKRGHPVVPVFQMDALRGITHQPRPQSARVRTNRNSRVGLLQADVRHVAAMLSESGTAPGKIRYHWFEWHMLQPVRC